MYGWAGKKRDAKTSAYGMASSSVVRSLTNVRDFLIATGAIIKGAL